MTAISAHRGRIFHFTEHASLQTAHLDWEYIEDGLLLVQDGVVLETGAAARLLPALPEGLQPVEHGRRLLMPGFIDAHCHAPQTGAIAGYGEQLLQWLQNYIFPEEARFADPAYADAGNAFFLDELLRNGTTTAAVYGSSHKAATESLFSQAHARNMRLIAGKTLMDRDAGPEVLDTPESAYADSRALMHAWHGKGRLAYAVTPRFLPSCSAAEMQAAGRLLRENPEIYMQTHLSENLAEIRLVAELFPESRGYLDAYDSFGLLGRRSLFGHCIHLSDDEFQRMAETGCVACWCPDSNAFLGSGIFDLVRARRFGLHVALASDVSAATSFSMLAIMAMAYKVTALRTETRLSPFEAFYLATLGAARALCLEDRIGCFARGREADFIVLDPECTPLLAYRLERARSLEDELFVLMMLGDDRAVAATYLAGEPALS